MKYYQIETVPNICLTNILFGTSPQVPALVRCSQDVPGNNTFPNVCHHSLGCPTDSRVIPLEGLWNEDTGDMKTGNLIRSDFTQLESRKLQMFHIDLTFLPVIGGILSLYTDLFQSNQHDKSDECC